MDTLTKIANKKALLKQAEILLFLREEPDYMLVKRCYERELVYKRRRSVLERYNIYLSKLEKHL